MSRRKSDVMDLVAWKRAQPHLEHELGLPASSNRLGGARHQKRSCRLSPDLDELHLLPKSVDVQCGGISKFRTTRPLLHR